jgi:hypothetical protein
VNIIIIIFHAILTKQRGFSPSCIQFLGYFWWKVFTTCVAEQWHFSNIWKRLDKLRHSLTAPSCTITWGNSGEVQAGKTVTFLVEVHTWTMQPYTKDDVEAVLEVIVTHPNGDSTAAVKSKVGDDVGKSHQVQVSFPTRKAGKYVVSIKAKGHEIFSSPFTITVVAGSVDSSKSGLVRGCKTAVVVQGMDHCLEVELKDQHGNPVDRDKQFNALLLKVLLSERDSVDDSVSIQTVISSKDQMGQFEISFKVDLEGYFMGSIEYNGNPLENGNFSVLCINDHLSEVVKSHVAKRSVYLWFECRLLWKSAGKCSKPGKLKKVYCYVTPKQIVIKEFYLYVIPKRLFTFRLQPKTKLLFGDDMSSDLCTMISDRRRSSVVSIEEARLALHRDRFMSETDELVRPESTENMFTLDDGHQQVTLISAKRSEIAATYLAYLSKNTGGSETFQERKEFFFQELQSHHSKHSRRGKTVVVNRSNLLADTMRTVKDYKTSDWCQSWTIRFTGEEAYDIGGVSREFFTVITSSLFDASHGYFEQFKDDKQALVHPSHSIHCSKLFEFAGRIVGKCLLETAHGNVRLVKARFMRSFLAQLIGLRINYGFFETDDPDLYVSKIEYLKDNDAEDLELVFAEEEYNENGQVSKVVPLKHHGDEIPVTNQNKLEYLDLLAQYRLVTRVEDNVEAFLKGLNDIVPMDLLSIFNENELELLMCGSTKFNVEDLKMHCDTDFFYFSRVIDWFWQAVENFTQEELSKLLQFTTGSSQLPPGGFSELSPPFKITHSPTSDALPTSHTCFNQLCLPDYHSFEQLHSSLVLAINEGSEGFGMI